MNAFEERGKGRHGFPVAAHDPKDFVRGIELVSRDAPLPVAETGESLRVRQIRAQAAAWRKADEITTLLSD